VASYVSVGVAQLNTVTRKLSSLCVFVRHTGGNAFPISSSNCEEILLILQIQMMISLWAAYTK
jgi:hypothetical protein